MKIRCGRAGGYACVVEILMYVVSITSDSHRSIDGFDINR